MNRPPDVSVLLPVRDGLPHLEDAVTSLEGQSWSDFEVLAVDDGSTDGSPGTLERWAARDARVRILRQAPSGIVPALELARAHARGRYLARMDADDVALPHRLERQRAYLEAHPSVVAVGCRVTYFPAEAVRDGARRYEAWMNGSSTPEEVAEELFVECPLAHPTFFLRAEAVDAVGGYRDPGWPEDYDLLLRLWEAGGALAKVPEVLLRWREAPDRLSRIHPRYSPEAFRLCKVHYLRRSLLAEGRGAVIWGAGPVGKALARALQEAGTEVVAFVEVDPRKVGQNIHGAPVLDTAAGLAVEGPLHLGAVGQEGARETIRGLLEGAGRAPLRDFVLTA